MNVREFCALGGAASCLWPRWFVLRAVGLIYVLAFAGIIVEGKALVGPRGIAPVADFCSALHRIFPGFAERFLRAPSLFWATSAPAMIILLEWAGLAAAVALVFNLWPRMALFVCWTAFLSFVATWQLFTSSIDDQLLLEVALICIPFAPSGFRPGLGAAAPPRPIALFAVRWLLIRMMLTSGLIKLVGRDPHWRNLTAMQAMYQTSPLPTFLGYMAHQIPHAGQIAEIGLTFTAEIAAPLLAVLAGRTGRWFAFFAWLAFQVGIELTTSFGWLNTASIAWGVLLLDDSMVAAAAWRVGLGRYFPLAGPALAAPLPACSTIRLLGMRAFLGLQIGLTLYFSAAVFAGRTYTGIPHLRSRPVEFLLRDFKSANAYIPYASFPSAKYEVEFIGSNDGGATWRSYEFKFKPQDAAHMCPYVAPWLDRFEASLQLAVNLPRSPLVPRVAALLIARNGDVMALFKSDPFLDRPATWVRMPVYRFTFTPLAVYQQTGRFWDKLPVGDYMPAVYLDDHGTIKERESPAPKPL